MVRLHSEIGRGTRVCLYLPRHEPTTATAPGARAPAVVNGIATWAATGRTILVVEDEAEVRGQIVEALRDLGSTIIEGKDGLSALRTIQSPAAVDVLVTDVGLPGMNGRQLAEAARESRPGLPVILMTGYAGAAIEVAPAPGIEIIRKPFALGELTAVVAATLERLVLS